MKNKKLWITAVLLSGMLALPVRAAVRKKKKKIKVVCDHTFSAFSGGLCTGSEPDPTKNGPNHTENIHGSG